MKKVHDDNVAFGKRLKELREQAGLSVAQVAKEIGVANSTYREWEYGRAITGLPYPRLAHALEIDLYQLFGLISRPENRGLRKPSQVRKLLQIKAALEQVIEQL